MKIIIILQNVGKLIFSEAEVSAVVESMNHKLFCIQYTNYKSFINELVTLKLQ